MWRMQCRRSWCSWRVRSSSCFKDESILEAAVVLALATAQGDGAVRLDA